jgi:hypothetical protein
VSRPLFQTRVPPYEFNSGRYYAVSRDGRRFLINSELEAAGPSPITVVTNWRAAGGQSR